MSENLTLAQRLKEQKQRENEITQNLMKQQLDDMRKELTSILKSELNTLKKDTKNQTKSISWSMFKSRILWPSLTGLSLCIGILGGSWGAMHYMTSKTLNLSQNIAEMNQNIAKLESEGGKIKLNRCGDQKRLCAKIDIRDRNGFGERGEWRILEGY